MWFWTIFFAITTVVLAVALGFAVFYLVRWARIIMILEDDFSDTIDSMASVEEALTKILGMQLFFDSKEVKLVVQSALSEVKTSRLTVNRLIQKFVERSKQKYTVVMEDGEEAVEELAERFRREKMLKEGNSLQQDDFTIEEKIRTGQAPSSRH